MRVVRRDENGRGRIGLSVLAALAATVAFAPLCAGQMFNDDVQRLMSKGKLGKGRVGVSIIDVASGDVLANVRAGEAFIPASNMKLLSSGAALFTLGKDFVFRTRVEAVPGAQPTDPQRLVVIGDGDPALGDPDVLSQMSPKMTVGDLLGTIADAVRKDGGTQFGELVVDDRVFDRDTIHPSWPVDQLNRWYCAEVMGVNFHTNVVNFFPAPSPDGVGRPPSYTIQPEAPWLEVENKGRTVKEGNNSAWLTRAADANKFTLFGEIKFRAQVPVEVTMHEPALFMGQVLADALDAKGVKVGDGTSGGHANPHVRLAAAKESLGTGKSLAVVSTPMQVVLDRCNSDSQNLFAEALLKRTAYQVTGEPGSWGSGATVLRMLLTEKLGPEYAASTEIADGSGMSALNKVRPSTLTHWIAALAKNSETSEAFMHSLATPGRGTLSKRFMASKLACNVHAKSGAINGVRCLSGVVVHPTSGRMIAFSVMGNELQGDGIRASMEIAEEVVEMIDRWLAKTSPISKRAEVGG
jgi:D-alanyl-D-alanine carboxypeptidase/D-alanyl-D-alanine-endopeptidase (penicillin-binding protein 4)